MKVELRNRLAYMKDLIVSYSVLLGYEKEKGGCLGSCSHPDLDKHYNKATKVRSEWCEVCEKDIYNTKMLLHVHNLLKDPNVTATELRANMRYLDKYIKDNKITDKVSRVPKSLITPTAPDIKKVLKEQRTPLRKKAEKESRKPSDVKVYKKVARSNEVNEKENTDMRPSVDNYHKLKQEGKKESDIAEIFGLHNAAYYSWKREVGLMSKRKTKTKKKPANAPKKKSVQKQETKPTEEKVMQVSYGENVNIEDFPGGEHLKNKERQEVESDLQENVHSSRVGATENSIAERDVAKREESNRVHCIDLRDEGLVDLIKSYYRKSASDLMQTSDADNLRAAANKLDKLAELLEVSRGQ